ncbi:MAG: hypothetical protein ACE5HC_02255 [Candidatus Binatia bacterium]
MKGNPAQFEVMGSRLGFRIDAEGREGLNLVWKCGGFPTFLCLGIAAGLLFLSVPILEAIRQKGLQGPAGSLWYFPIMNLILLGISLFLFSLKRSISFHKKEQRVLLRKRSIFRTTELSVNYDEVQALQLENDEVYSGFAVAGSSAAQKYPVPSLRLVLREGESVLLDRGGLRRLETLGKHISEALGKPLRSPGVRSP